MKNTWKVFWHGVIVTLLIAVTSTSVPDKVTWVWCVPIVAAFVSYFLTHGTMLLDMFKSELSKHFKLNISDIVSSGIFCFYTTILTTVLTWLTTNTHITLHLIWLSIMSAIWYGIKNFLKNSQGQIAAEPEQTINK